MEYIRSHWKHDSPDDPVVMYYEIGNERIVLRVIEVFPDGSTGYADRARKVEVGGTHLGEGAVPAFDEIKQVTGIESVLITKSEFEDAWRRAVDE
ncbi:MAG: hypothetical protein IPK69_09450 [Phycisphaerales bacterium]|nr:MAG: hypothetical protein IPK69_09450 [Phycisphaerales bacterium]